MEDGVDVDEAFYRVERRAARRVDDRSAFLVPALSMRPGARTAEVVCVDILCKCDRRSTLGHDSVLDAAQLIDDEIDA